MKWNRQKKIWNPKREQIRSCYFLYTALFYFLPIFTWDWRDSAFQNYLSIRTGKKRSICQSLPIRCIHVVMCLMHWICTQQQNRSKKRWKEFCGNARDRIKRIHECVIGVRQIIRVHNRKNASKNHFRLCQNLAMCQVGNVLCKSIKIWRNKTKP